MLNLLNFGVEAKASWLQSGLYFKDDAGKFDSGNKSEICIK
jgi:hypothetical protein